MTVYFKRPDYSPNWGKVVNSLVPAVPSAASLIAAAAGASTTPIALAAGAATFIAAVHKAIGDAAGAAKTGHTVDERAWHWLWVSLTIAIFDFLSQRELRSPLDAQEKKDAVRDFLTDALSPKGEAVLDPSMLINPAACPLVAAAIDRLPRLARQIAPEHNLSDARMVADFARILRATSARVYALDTPYYRPVEDAVTGPFSEGARRDFAWARHEDWIRGLFYRDPIFSPDEPKNISLSAVYHRLRCFWHEGHRPETEGARPRRVAHVADLHATLHAWLDAGDRGDAIRVVAGGPGSGKSSFARKFAIDVIAAARHRVIFVPLQHMAFRDDLEASIGATLAKRAKAVAVPGMGFEENPLYWRDATLPILLVFDGLDELSHAEDEARDLALRFISMAKTLLDSLNDTDAAPPVHALVLGRSTACQAGMEQARLPLSALIHVASLTPITPRSLSGHVALHTANQAVAVDEVHDPKGLAGADERQAFWRRWAAARGIAAQPVPEAVTAKELGELSAEPLLLHLLIVSGYAGARWHEVAENRNRIYAAIFEKIHARDRKKKKHSIAQRLDEEDFFTLLECLGLAAWRGNGRTGTAKDFEKLRKLHLPVAQAKRFKSLSEAELCNVAVLFYTRRDLERWGFEFIHKSFGEYLAARALLSAGMRAAAVRKGDDPTGLEEVALHWTMLVDRGELSEEVLDFLYDEARLQPPHAAESCLPHLAELFGWTLKHGMPAHKVCPKATWREIETMQRRAESALLAVLDALSRLRRSARSSEETQERPRAIFSADWSRAPREVLHFLNRIQATLASPIRRALGCVDLAGANLSWADLSGADLSGANLDGSNLTWADLRSADVSGANLGGANLDGAYLLDVDLTNANLSGANLSRVQLRQACLNGANLSGADLRDAYLLDANLTDAILRGANLSKACLIGAGLSGATLSGAHLGSARLIRANLRKANLSGAKLSSADLKDAEFARASLRSTDLASSRNLSPEMVESAFGVRNGIGRTQLPSGMRYPEHWHQAEDGARDTSEAVEAYQVAYEVWLREPQLAG